MPFSFLGFAPFYLPSFLASWLRVSLAGVPHQNLLLVHKDSKRVLLVFTFLKSYLIGQHASSLFSVLLSLSIMFPFQFTVS